MTATTMVTIHSYANTSNSCPHTTNTHITRHILSRIFRLTLRRTKIQQVPIHPPCQRHDHLHSDAHIDQPIYETH